MNNKEAIHFLENQVTKDRDGLPEDLFLFVSRLTPLICVDLLIKDDEDRTLFTWRDDEIFGRGWHLPGGVIRHNERFEDRILKVGQIELGANLAFDPEPCRFIQDLDISKRDRGHFIAFLYRCRLLSQPDESIRYSSAGEPRVGEWAWFSGKPEALLKVHEVYEPYFV
ncbi:NUDIX hydrolase [Paenibacillus radicis (ex Xue et al. 2023)]|uniref:NUDIX hydrolase n=1 Tax=Paenibacillus radicis (ex Xue et al. 2023) TaxID=2972489 RepID=A0ABT1YH25_9BACL|nr:NUDIX hydrolase [Paenibacillus radicis (ex Xue et al. 2023)]MCR8632483.1 NUDIX hydrolase [Paenibacillus radicis (ex Xue et al. 2023)]